MPNTPTRPTLIYQGVSVSPILAQRAVGNYVIALGTIGYRNTDYIFDAQGNLTDSEDRYGGAIEEYAWSNTHSRFYFFYGTSPTDLHYKFYVSIPL